MFEGRSMDDLQRLFIGACMKLKDVTTLTPDEKSLIHVSLVEYVCNKAIETGEDKK